MKTGPKPRKITTQLLEQIEFQASRGLSQQQICHAIGISETWWYDAKQKSAEISESFKRVQAKGLVEVSNVLRTGSEWEDRSCVFFSEKSRSRSVV